MAKEFDFPYISRRMIIKQNKIYLIKLDLFGKKPWGNSTFGPLWQLGSFGDYKHVLHRF